MFMLNRRALTARGSGFPFGVSLVAFFLERLDLGAALRGMSVPHRSPVILWRRAATRLSVGARRVSPLATMRQPQTLQ